VRDKRERESRVGIGEQFILFSLTLALAIMVGMIGAPDKWLAAIFCTVPTFAGMISYYRKRMPSRVFWTALAWTFLFHLVLLWVVFGVILKKRDDVGLLVCTPGILLEWFFLHHGLKFIERKCAK
jgi:hypothetical protein